MRKQPLELKKFKSLLRIKNSKVTYIHNLELFSSFDGNYYVKLFIRVNKVKGSCTVDLKVKEDGSLTASSYSNLNCSDQQERLKWFVLFEDPMFTQQIENATVGMIEVFNKKSA